MEEQEEVNEIHNSRIPCIISAPILLTTTVSQQQVLASNLGPTSTNSEGEPQIKPGMLILTPFENGATKVILSNSTDVQAINGGYLAKDLTVKADDPILTEIIDNKKVTKIFLPYIR